MPRTTFHPAACFSEFRSVYRILRLESLALTRLAASFLDHLPRLWERDYVPDTDDILNCRVQMTGVTETLVNAHGNAFRFIDVGSMTGERRNGSIVSRM